MSLLADIKPNLCLDLKEGINATCWDNRLLALDYSSPAQQSFPTTAGGVISGHTAEEIWLCDEASGNLVGEVSSETLVENGSPIRGTAVGFYDGTDMYSKKCVEFAAATSADDFTHATNSFLDLDAAESIAFLVVFRTTKPAEASETLFGKRVGSTRYLFETISGGQVRWTMRDDDDPSNTTLTSTSTDYDDGAWHGALIMADRTADSMQMFTDLETSTTATPPDGSFTIAAGFQVGAVSSFNSSPVQIAYLAVFKGAQAEGFTQAKFDAFWNHAVDPGTGGIFPQLDTYSRASLACPVVGSESGFGLRVAKFAADKFAHGWDTDFTHSNKLGLLVEAAATNICLQSEDVTTTWGNGNSTDAANVAEAPDGTKTADSVTATSDGGRLLQGIITVAETEYTLSVFVKRNGGSNVTGVLSFENGHTGVDIANQAFTATDEWQRVEVTGTADSGMTVSNFHIHVDTSGESIFVWGMQMEQSAYATSYIPTTSASATRSKTECELTNTDGNTYWQSAAGELKAVLAFSRNDTNQVPNLLEGYGGSNSDRATLGFANDEKQNWILRDSAGSTVYSGTSPGLAITPGNENTCRWRWDATNTLPGSSNQNIDFILNGAQSDGHSGTWTAGTGATTLYIGHSKDGAVQIDGLIATIDVFDKPQAIS